MMALRGLDEAERAALKSRPHSPAAQRAAFLCPSVRVVFLSEPHAAKAEVWLANAMNPNPAT